MKPNIINFFKFLEIKKNEPIPLLVKIQINPELDLDIDSLNQLSPKFRAKVLNIKLGEKRFKNLNRFGDLVDGLSLASIDNSSMSYGSDAYVLIDIYGNQTIEGVNFEDIEHSGLYKAAYFNTKLKKIIFEYVADFDYGEGRLAKAKSLFSYSDVYFFINKEGNRSVEGINYDGLKDNYERAMFWNTINFNANTSNKPFDLSSVSEFMYVNKTIARVISRTEGRTFMNNEGIIPLEYPYKKDSIWAKANEEFNEHRTMLKNKL